jgi:tRNA modification GTPase
MTDTIFAISSGAGMAGVAIIRVSGPHSRAALAAFTGALPTPRLASLRTLRDPVDRTVVDRGLVLWFPGPQSFTGEDSAEFHIHGGSSVVAAMLRVLGGMAGMRPAEAGEFSLRAFRNGKLDLVEAEGLADLLHARSERQRALAARQMTGQSSGIFEAWRRDLIELVARVEAAIDFADEDGVAEVALAEISPRCQMLRIRMIGALGSAMAAARVRQGLRIVLAGPPNVGKSSLLNRLVERDAAIVSAIPGTTRDAIEADLLLGGVPAILIDTAGLRAASGDEIEAEGMARSRRHLANADITLWISAPDIPESEPANDIDSEAIWVENKSDLHAKKLIHIRNDSAVTPHYRISALTGDGISTLLSALEKRAVALLAGADDAIVVRERQHLAVTKTVAALDAALSPDIPELELIAEHLRSATDELGRLTGRIGVEDVLDAVFRDFCIGK